ncbi:MAG: phytoene/squalene synthase family protein [Steroidobacteraceae bacterium]
MDSVSSDEVYQDQILPHVSRTFALTIPQLPADLRTAVTCAYLLCRIADTIEDEPALSPAETLAFLHRFSEMLLGRGDPQALAREIAARLSERTLPAERDLVCNMERVVAVLAQLNAPQRAAIQRCVELMCRGMPRFQFSASLKGLARSSDLDDYCYYVAGVVGEMLTDLFCDYSPQIARQRAALSAIAASFAQGLQMTNILKDVWEDRGRGACWLPQEVFTRHGVDLGDLASEPFDPRFGAGMRELVGVAHAHLRNALDYTLLIPGNETGIRRFCLWAIGLAVLTLRKIERNPRFTAGAQVKVTRSAVAMTRLLTNVAGRSDGALRLLFAQAARGLPLARLSDLRRARPAPPSLDAATVDEPEHALRRFYGNSGS